jgi:putative hemolysin
MTWLTHINKQKVMGGALSMLTGGWLWAGIVLLLALSFILSAAETAFTSLSPRQAKSIEKTHPGTMGPWLLHEERVLAAMLIGINLTTVGMGSLAAILSHESGWTMGEPILTTALLAIVFGILTLFFGAILPKALARQNPEQWALALSGATTVLSKGLSPITKLLVNLLERWHGPRSAGKGASKPLTTWELKEILAHSSLPYKSKRILTNLIQFAALPVRLVMTPREDIFAVDVKQGQWQIIQSVAQSPYSRIPVFRGSLDNIIGIVYSRDLLLAWRSQALVVLEDLLRPAHAISLDAPLAEYLRAFRTGQQHISLVKDRSGKIRGLLTLEDAVEAIVGRIPSEPNL